MESSKQQNQTPVFTFDRKYRDIKHPETFQKCDYDAITLSRDSDFLSHMMANNRQYISQIIHCKEEQLKTQNKDVKDKMFANLKNINDINIFVESILFLKKISDNSDIAKYENIFCDILTNTKDCNIETLKKIMDIFDIFNLTPSVIKAFEIYIDKCFDSCDTLKDCETIHVMTKNMITYTKKCKMVESFKRIVKKNISETVFDIDKERIFKQLISFLQKFPDEDEAQYKYKNFLLPIIIEIFLDMGQSKKDLWDFMSAYVSNKSNSSSLLYDNDIHIVNALMVKYEKMQCKRQSDPKSYVMKNMSNMTPNIIAKYIDDIDTIEKSLSYTDFLKKVPSVCFVFSNTNGLIRCFTFGLHLDYFTKGLESANAFVKHREMACVFGMLALNSNNISLYKSIVLKYPDLENFLIEYSFLTSTPDTFYKVILNSNNVKLGDSFGQMNSSGDYHRFANPILKNVTLSYCMFRFYNLHHSLNEKSVSIYPPWRQSGKNNLLIAERNEKIDYARDLYRLRKN